MAGKAREVIAQSKKQIFGETINIKESLTKDHEQQLTQLSKLIQIKEKEQGEKYTQEITQLKQLLQKLSDEQLSAQEQISILKQENYQLNETIQSLGGEVDALAAQNAKKAEELAAQDLAVARLKEEHQAELALVRQKFKDKKSALKQTYDSRVGALRETVSSVQAEMERVKSDFLQTFQNQEAQLSNVEERYQREVSEIEEQHRMAVQTMNTKYQYASQGQQELNTSLQVKNERIRSLESQVRERDVELKGFRSSKEFEIKTLEKNVSDLQLALKMKEDEMTRVLQAYE